MFCRSCLQLWKRKPHNETQGQDKNNKVRTGFTNTAVSMEMENKDGYQGLQREVEGYEKLRVESNMYEEIPEPAYDYLDPQMPGLEEPGTREETDTDGYLKLQK